MNEPTHDTYYSLADFDRVKKIDAHVHLRTDFDTIFIRQAARDHFRLLNVSVYTSPSRTPEAQENFSLKLIGEFPDIVTYGTTFSLEGFNKKDWETNTMAYLEKSISNGAIAVKVWKNIGMELKNEHGELVMITDEKFEPILQLLIEKDITLLGHLGEPKNTWLPLEEMTVQGDRDYFRENPRYHMYNFPDFPTYEDQISARDQMLANNPNLRFVGAHLGSLEYDVNELAKRLDQFPNMAVDMAERISHLQYQAITNWKGVRDFFINYQDRLIYGTDLRAGASDIQAKGLTDPEEIANHAHEVWLRHWQFFTGDDEMTVPKVKGTFKGLKLPRTVVDKIYRTNAEKWYPGLLH
ncbi:amidohydrolase family protein [Cyclobacterium jeungdonense]|uniref:Amidohydrolase family protein n=1 Tax=Cyclobacterium jeungdonense TaxID=708087 RepID=A0ABT8CCI4_9BACT|nr:amidohydrolase family protein [Cyclobacterium jeungdonense]MDN3690520.1 amidohydrolase family protein [Cyclobacterium jeungdonense]